MSEKPAPQNRGLLTNLFILAARWDKHQQLRNQTLLSYPDVIPVDEEMKRRKRRTLLLPICINCTTKSVLTGPTYPDVYHPDDTVLS